MRRAPAAIDESDFNGSHPFGKSRLVVTETKPASRTQSERTAATKRALLDAAVRVVHKLGYAGATTALIADEAGVSRGAILHHFGTRADFMAAVIKDVFQREHEELDRLTGSSGAPSVSDWPAMLWQVYSQPSGIATIEILHAARSDPELAERVVSTQQEIERLASSNLQSKFGIPSNTAALDEMRLLVWAVRGLALAQIHVEDPDEIIRSIRVLSRALAAAQDAGVFGRSKKAK
jgi:AcrR family transcriptional regulator